ncbi:MAG: aminopeptidase [Candidatus Woesearchaeota archaeon]
MEPLRKTGLTTVLLGLALNFGCASKQPEYVFSAHEYKAPIAHKKSLKGQGEEQDFINKVALQPEHYWTGLQCEDKVDIGIGGTHFYTCRENLSDKFIKNIDFVADVKEYSQDELGIYPSLNYIVYKDTECESPKTLYILYIGSNTEFSQKYRPFYIKKKGDYFSYKAFDKLWSYVDDLLDEKKHYEEKGHDVHYREVKDFNNGAGCNLRDDFFEQKKARQIEVLIHEDWHHYLDIKKPVMESSKYLNECSATLVGLIGASEFAKLNDGEGSDLHKMAEKNLDRWYELSLDINYYYNLLEIIYNSDKSEEEKLKEKEEVLKEAKESFMELNNAKISSYRYYTKHFPLMYKIYKKLGSVDETIEVFEGMPDVSDEQEVVDYLEGIYYE